MTDGRVRPMQEAVYMEMKVRGLGGLGKRGRVGAWLSHPRRNCRITVLSSRMRHKRKSMRKRGRENEGRGSSKELATRFRSIIYVCRSMPKRLQEAANPIQ